MTPPPKAKAIHKTRRHKRVDMASLPPEVIAAVVSWLGPRDHASAVLASRRFGVLTPEERGRLHFARFAPKVLARVGSLDGLRYWHGVDPWRIDIHCLRAAAEGGHRALVEWIIDESIGGACPTEALCAAAKGGRVDLMRWLLDERDAAILNEVLGNAISSKCIGAVRLVLDRAHEIDHREGVCGGICPQGGGDRPENDHADGDDGGGEDEYSDHDDDDDKGDKEEDSDDKRLSDAHSCGRVWHQRPMRLAACTGDVAIVQLVYERCYYGDDPEVLERPLPEAAGSGATRVVEWILGRCADPDAISNAFDAALEHGRRDCAVAILSRWPDAARPAALYSWSFKPDDTLISAFDHALDVSLGTRPDPWPLAGTGAAEPAPEEIYDALMVHCIAKEFGNDWGKLVRMPLRGTHCDALFRWAVDRARPESLVSAACEMGHEGRIDRLAYCWARDVLAPEHVVAAMRGAAARGRVDVLAYVWSTFATGGCGACRVADAVRANAQMIADTAAESGDWTVVEWLQQHVDTRAHCTAAAFSVAANNGHAAFLKRLYAAGADRCRHPCDAPCQTDPEWKQRIFGLPTRCGLYDINDLWRHVARDGHYDVAQVLREHGALDGAWLRSDAALRGHVAICALDVAVNGPRKHDLMIQYAVQARDRACLSFALANGSVWKPTSVRYAHPITTAAKKGSRSLAELLAKHAVQIKIPLSECVHYDEESDYDSESD
ncbi:ankyrin repeat domain containing protein [Pandoravirus japonicus]|uniref:Ankyrin repeat domain containing protein n=1 Tax=Pandoravirus japonicus TaxID=2823154 RepID=A0A811BS05_9VIRU|nr:ankyrin repeat domain containing protein [Pandoravirus japonicus]